MSVIPDSCQAAVLTAYGAPLVLAEVEVPRELEYGAVLVRTTVATVCASDVHIWDGTSPGVREFPTILGHEMVGEVVRLGESADRDSIGRPLRIGDRITWSHGHCGRCYFCVVEREPTLCVNFRGYMVNSCRRYPFLIGGFAEYCYVYPTSGRLLIPDDVPDPLASAASCAMRTVVSAFARLGGLDERHTVVVQGAGPIGLFSVAKAVAGGAAQVFAVGGPQARLDVAAKWGAIPLSLEAMPSAEERLEAVMAATGGRGADVVVEASGVPAAFGEGIALLRRGGRYVVIGQVHQEAMPFNPSVVVLKQLSILGNMSAGIAHYYGALEFLREHADRFSWHDMISSTYPLARATDALQSMHDWREIKPVIATG